MTLEQLNEHLSFLWQWQAAKERLQSMRAVVLGAQQYDGMPHASGISDKVERLALIMADQEEDVNRLEKQLRKSTKAVTKFVNQISDERTRLIFRLRFIGGLSWDEVAKMIGGGNSPEAVKMCCYRFLLSQH